MCAVPTSVLPSAARILHCESSTVNIPRVETAGSVDGRRRRREDGRRAVVDAVIDLLLAGHTPSVEAVAGRAGVSVASVFRYFATLDDLRHEGIHRFLERIDHLLAVPAIGSGSLDDRIDRLVRARLRYYDAAAPVARQVRRQAVEVPDLAAGLQRVRSTLADQIAQHFGEELDAFRPGERGRRVAVLATITSFESWDQFTTAGVSARSMALAWREAIPPLLAPPIRSELGRITTPLGR